MIIKKRRADYNKRGDTPIEAMIFGASILGLILYLTGVLLYSYFHGSAIPFFSFLPGFNGTQAKAGQSLIFRYDTQTQTVQYYDGNSWIFPPVPINLGYKKMDIIDLNLLFEWMIEQKTSAGSGKKLELISYNADSTLIFYHYFCTKLYNDRYVVSDLSQSINKDAQCPA